MQSDLRGQRPLKHVIQRELQNLLVGLILNGKINDGDVVRVLANATELEINKKSLGVTA